MVQFVLVPREGFVPSEALETVFLRIDHWNDYSFVTMFQATIFDESGSRHDIGSVKIGFKGQSEDISTYSTIQNGTSELPIGYFSIGGDVDYYTLIYRGLSESFRLRYLHAIRDVAFLQENLDVADGERVFEVSLLRSVNLNTITGQYRRILSGGVPLTNYNFRFTLDSSARVAGYQLDFNVQANSKPTTNIHAIIGRNGVGKTTLLNRMISAATIGDNECRFETKRWFDFELIGNEYFTSLVSISFSAFDPFNPPAEQPDPSKGTCYFYVGLKSLADESGTLLKSQDDLNNELIVSLKLCLSEPSRRDRWIESIQNLESDDNFAEMGLLDLASIAGDDVEAKARGLLRRMSSGHAIVLLTITKLVSHVDEKTLVLFDEPESHLHPPLLSALVRSLSRLLSNRNAVAIIATHSPVVMQEIPRSCVWKITRSGVSSQWQRPEVETFGENVGVLTKEVFGLEVTKSGFNALLVEEASGALSYEDALESFGGQVGLEGRAILRSMIHSSDRDSK